MVLGKHFESVLVEHCVGSVRIWSFSGPHFPTFELIMERYSVSLRIQSECRKLRTRKTPNTGTFHAVEIRWTFGYLGLFLKSHKSVTVKLLLSFNN